MEGTTLSVSGPGSTAAADITASAPEGSRRGAGRGVSRGGWSLLGALRAPGRGGLALGMTATVRCRSRE